ncbi:MAG TPA: hypothetical protein VF971_02925 [Candidatus Limnocylindrales bacterium]|jgi:hypothetical protein
MRPSDRRPAPPRPAAVDLAAAVLVFGGLLGFGQVAVGDFAITGSLPAKGPIVGVALILYGTSTALGVIVRTGRLWLPAINLALLFAILYLLAIGRLLPLALGLAYGAAAASLLGSRGWFAAVARSRSPSSP